MSVTHQETKDPWVNFRRVGKGLIIVLAAPFWIPVLALMVLVIQLRNLGRWWEEN